MNGVLLQDLFSNVLLGLLALLLLAVVLVGTPQQTPSPRVDCKKNQESPSPWLTTVSLDKDGRRDVLISAVSWTSDAMPRLPQPKAATHVVHMRDGCLLACFRCAAGAVLDISIALGPDMPSCTKEVC